VQQARRSLALRLRELRVQAGLTGRTLAGRAGWHRTKVSKLEHAATAPSAADIRTWCALCGEEDLAPELVASLVAVDTMWTEWRRLERSGLRKAQEAVLPLWERTRRFRIYSPWLVPGPLQSGAYIRTLLTAARDRRGVLDDVEEAVAVRLDKQRVLGEGDHRFAVVLEETALRHRIGGADVLTGQLRHLLDVMSLPSLSLGVIPLTADRSMMRPVEMFFMFDDTQVNVEFVSGWLRVTTREEISMYDAVFTRLARMAVHGREARELVNRALRAQEH
jgi:transcriptional regulator with XRE-family HTH domain